jgi:hypothetical protein
MFWARFRSAVKDLALALLNATLILIALCLWLAWSLASKVDDITDQMLPNLVEMQPIRDDIGNLKEQLGAVRADLAIIARQGDELASETADRLSEKVSAIEDRVAEVRSRIDLVVDSPEIVIDYAIDAAFDRAEEAAVAIRSCTPSPSGSLDATQPQ